MGLLREVAQLMPDVDFRLWGDGVSAPGDTPEAVANVRIQGPFPHVSEIPLAEADAWLYNPDSDGVPSELLDIAMTGIPIVGSLVGGTAEVLGEAGAWPVRDAGQAAAYVEAIRVALAEPGEARRRATALRERLLRERTEKAFAAQVADALLIGENSTDGGR
jgi:glycosyltransferase involved in cell wall biosynthesis